MEIENTIKKFLTREKIAFHEHPFPNLKVLACDIDGNPYNIKIFEKSGIFKVKSFTATYDEFLVLSKMPEINRLNQTMFGTFSWYEKNHYAYLLSCELDQLCTGGITINEQLVEDVFVEVRKGVKALEQILTWKK